MGYALLKAKSSKILKKDSFSGEDETAEQICSRYVCKTRLAAASVCVGVGIGYIFGAYKLINCPSSQCKIEKLSQI